MQKEILRKFKESLISVAPIIAIVYLLTPWVQIPAAEMVVFGVSAVLLILGMTLFNIGADMAMTPMGNLIGAGLTKSKKISWLLLASFILGLLITVAEPDLSVLAKQVSEMMNGTVLIITVGVGVGLFLLLAVLRIIFKQNLAAVLMFFYMALFAFAAFLIDSGKGSLLPMAFDSGGVTTGPITVPFIMALGVGIAVTIGGRNSSENSFGLLALCSVGPVLAVLVLSLFTTGAPVFRLPDYAMDLSVRGILQRLLGNILDVVKALGLIVLFFLLLNFLLLKLPKQRLLRILIGIVITFVGLTVFLTSVSVGFMPVGFEIGSKLAGMPWYVTVILGFVLGVVVVLAEPAVHVLNVQVEETTVGTITRKTMMIALAIGVGLSLALSIVRIIFNFSILYYLIPGYLISLGLSLLVPKLYTAIAFDSGGVASGPLTSGFILPLAIGFCSSHADETSVLQLGFGIVAMVAMTPLITIQLLGFRSIAAALIRHRRNVRRIVAADDEQIISFR
ncbi:MAG: DUF1538 domain-containing protein [Clostridia bacterium]|nr:DUF1538 domain-containing protein [Clostridia bacterium]